MKLNWSVVNYFDVLPCAMMRLASDRILEMGLFVIVSYLL